MFAMIAQHKLFKTVTAVLLGAAFGAGSLQTGLPTASAAEAAGSGHSGSSAARSALLLDCGPGPVAPGYSKLLPSTSYKSSSGGYGFLNPKKVTGHDRGEPDALRGDFCVPKTPLRADVPNGEYQVTILSGDSTEASSTTVTAEGSVTASLTAAAGQFDQMTLTAAVNDRKLDLEFGGSAPRINALEISRVYKFDFGPGAVERGYTPVTDKSAYSPAKGYGFSDVTKVTYGADRGAPDALRGDYLGASGIPFLLDLPNGDYEVSLISGDQTEPNLVDVKAEGIYRAKALAAAAGEFSTSTFNVAVIDGQLSIEILGAVPRLNSLVVKKRPSRVQGDKPTAYLAGDSTVQTYNSRFYPQAGWGQKIGEYFTDGVLFANRAIGGRSSRSFVNDGRLDSILNEIRPGDYLFVQFGHNDASSNPERYAAPYTTYKEYLTMYIVGAKQRGATPVLVTPVGRRSWDENGLFKNDFPDHYAAMKQVAEEQHVQLIDLNARSIEYYNTVGIEETKALFLWLEPGQYPNFPNGVQDNTHFKEEGAVQIARLVTEGIRDLKLGMAAFIK
ncbi:MULTISPECIES: rhamnogalacturonan acetylesterase [Paenibacillus]|uniref:rhamnogalacturonan acetylesterase n=1 Tax=Paenibacillus TaxID=44249 RepID=UPI0022B8B33F|nr:SGNH/GDSL hydrolase family protein [Paenibacillus caseinilyticus]MCZ8522537.1 GDSL-type esterase/lipase family protein [Paenibacillus caseinilyticus]